MRTVLHHLPRPLRQRRATRLAPHERLIDLKQRIQELENLVAIISRGKYQWESTFDAITSPLSLIDDHYRIQRANLKLASVAGEKITAVIGKKCYDILADRKSPCPGCPVKEAWRKRGQEMQLLAEPIRGRDYQVSAYPYQGDHVGKPWAVVYYQDITEEKRLTQELMQQEKMAAIGMLAGGVAHEINNPLGGILAMVQLMLRDLENAGASTLKNDLIEVENAAQRCKKIVADLLDFSRASSDTDNREVAINAVIEKALRFLSLEFRSLNIELKSDLAADLPPVSGDANRLTQVVLNLLSNACHSLSQGGTITVETSCDPKEKQVVIRISDTGSGISPAHLGKIFDPFFTTKEPGKGTGLGLSISYRIIQDHRGRITVKSRLKKGTTFTIHLPMHEKGG